MKEITIFDIVGISISTTPILYAFIYMTIKNLKLTSTLVILVDMLIVGIGASWLRLSVATKPGDYVLLLTLGVLILYTYYTYILAVASKESIRSPALLKAQEMHTGDLKDLLDTWKSSIKNSDIFSVDIYDYNYNPHKLSIINNLYDDMYNYHLPLLPEGPKLKTNWSEFQNLINSYIEFYTDFRDKLNQNINREIEEKTGLDAENVCSYFIKSIYEQYMYYWSNNGLKMYPSDFHKIKYSINDNELHIDSGPMDSMTSQSGGIRVAEGNQDTLKKLEEIHKRMMEDPACLAMYKTEIEELLEQHKRLSDLKDHIIETIGELKRYPLFPGTKCEILKKF